LARVSRVGVGLARVSLARVSLIPVSLVGVSLVGVSLVRVARVHISSGAHAAPAKGQRPGKVSRGQIESKSVHWISLILDARRKQKSRSVSPQEADPEGPFGDPQYRGKPRFWREPAES